MLDILQAFLCFVAIASLLFVLAGEVERIGRGH